MQVNKLQKFYTDNEQTITGLSKLFDLPVATILAIISVESNDDDGFSPDGRLIIRFEAHKFFKYAKNKVLVKEHFRWDEKQPWKNQQVRLSKSDFFTLYHGKQALEYAVFRLAKQLDEHAAFMSISMGLPQIMGFNYKRIGYTTAEEMYDDFDIGTNAQIEGLFNFCTQTMRRYLREEQFFNFAKQYNGEGQAATYAQRIVDAIAKVDTWLVKPIEQNADESDAIDGYDEES